MQKVDLRISWLYLEELTGSIAALLPGGVDDATGAVPHGGDPDVLTAAASFRDRAGICWGTSPDGRLEELNPVDSAT
jgi:hypothetical protein